MLLPIRGLRYTVTVRQSPYTSLYLVVEVSRTPPFSSICKLLRPALEMR